MGSFDKDHNLISQPLTENPDLIMRSFVKSRSFISQSFDKNNWFHNLLMIATALFCDHMGKIAVWFCDCLLKILKSRKLLFTEVLSLDIRIENRILIFFPSSHWRISVCFSQDSLRNLAICFCRWLMDYMFFFSCEKDKIIIFFNGWMIRFMIFP